MLDINFIRENKELIAEAARKKRVEFDVEALIEADDKRRTLLASIEKRRAEQNVTSGRITNADSQEERNGLIESMRFVKDALEQEEEKLKEVMRDWQRMMLAVPNIPDMEVPEGENDKDNKEVRAWGVKPSEAPLNGHIELMEALDMADFARGVKVSGFRGYVLKNDGALLNFALWQLTLDFFVKKGFAPYLLPSRVKRESLLGTGYLPQGEEDLYKDQDGDYFAGTAEAPAMAYFMDDIIERDKLPIKLLGFSNCFRREAGSHGKDTRGIMRVHEFFKFEQVVLCEASHEQSVKFHEELTANAEELMQALEIPYRVVVNCGADLGLGQVKKYDIEAWVPSENKYRETHSASYFHDFQTRRLNIRYRDADGKLRFAHSLNNTAIATPRTLIPLIENHQQADGSIAVPLALRLFFGKDVIRKE